MELPIWPGTLSGVGVTLLGTLLVMMTWQRMLRRITARIDQEQPSLGFLLLNASRYPVLAVMLTTGLKLALISAPRFTSQTLAIKVIGLLVGFSVIVALGELLFAIAVDYYLRHRHQTEIPTIFNQLAKGLLYLIVALSLVSTTMKVDITPLLTTSAVFTMILGLALQDHLSNLFSGLAVHISPPFRIGDWIASGSHKGKVVESNWRATTLRTLDNQMVTIPNNDLAKKEIVNLTPHTGRFGQNLEVGLEYGASPSRVVEALLTAARSLDDILHRPAPKVFMQSFDDFSIRYRLKYWISDLARVDDIRSLLARRVWHTLRRQGLNIPFPIREVIQRPSAGTRAEVIRRRLKLLGKVDFLASLDRKDLVHLARVADDREFESGETVFEKGSEGTDCFIIVRGRVGVYTGDPQRHPPIATLGEGAFFGEMSLLTGATRAATIVAQTDILLLEISKSDLQSLLERRSEIAEIFSQILADRQRDLATRQADTTPTDLPERDANLAEATRFESRSALLTRIRTFFGI